jgi:hypothetical protein
MGVKPVSFGIFTKGVDASTSVLTQPKGSIPRGSNLLLSKRGSLRTVDGSDIIDAYNGTPISGRGRAMCEFFFQPTGVAGYYLRIMQALDQPLGPPQNLTGTLTTGGGLTSGQAYYWVVTALDGDGGETTVSNELTLTPSGGNLSVTLNWNIVPNAFAYNVYRGTTSGGEVLLTGTGLPVQGNTQYIDNGSATVNGGSIAAAIIEAQGFAGQMTTQYYFESNVPFATKVGTTAIYTAGTNANLNGMYTVSFVSGARSMNLTGPSLLAFTQSTGGTLLINSGSPPVTDTTQQTALYAMLPPSEGISYTDANIVALFPAAQSSGTLQEGYSPNGGVQGAVNLVPQMVQFTNQAVLALGNGFAPQVYSDPNGTPTNPATIVPISSITVDANGVVTVTTASPHNLNPVFPAFTYPYWIADTAYQVGDAVTPTNPNGYYYTVTVAGTSGPNQPNWPTTIGGHIYDSNGLPGGVEWVNSDTIPIPSSTQGLGSNVVIQGVSDTFYDTNGHGASAFTVIAIPSITTFKIVNLNAIGQPSSSGGTVTVSTKPVASTFVPSYPVWTASSVYAINSVIAPIAANGYYYIATQAGTSGTSEPTFPTTVGATVADDSVVWQNGGTLVSAAPAPPGCAHLSVYAGSLWMFNTGISNSGPATNTGTGTVPIVKAGSGLDGPCSLRMSDVDNMQSWNPINQAYLDKDDGTEGMGLASFTIAAQGIPPEGSLCAFKRRAVYQIVGVFGADNFAIQRVQSDMGVLAPRTLQFVPGFGLVRLTYLGIAVFDSVNDRIVSTQVEPYLIGSNDPDNADIVPMDPEWQTIAQSALTAKPPMYCCAIPVASMPGSSLGALTQIMCFDMVLKAWAIVNLPFPISTMVGVLTFATTGQTAFGSWNDGTLQAWQAGDETWATSMSGFATPGQVAWAVRTPTNASKNASERLYLRRVVVLGQQTGSAPSTMNIQVRNGGVVFRNQNVNMPSSGDVQVQSAAGQIGRRFDAVVSGQGLITIDSFEMHLEPRPVGVLSGRIS